MKRQVMTMLSLNKRKAYFKALGLGEYNKESILKLQKMKVAWVRSVALWA